jgi:hypothetical protein
VHNAVFPGNLSGLPALATIPGDLLYDWGTSDLNNGDNANTGLVEGMLNSLTTVQGDVTLELPPNANSALVRLAHVGGSLTLHPDGSFTQVRKNVLPQLADVGGDLTLDRTGFNDCSGGAYWPDLDTVGGALRAQNAAAEFLDSVGATGASHLTVGSLEMAQTGSGRIPLHDDAVILGSGDATFTDNAELCPCLIDAFAAAQALLGWTGIVSSSGNGSGAACEPCPQPASCP